MFAALRRGRYALQPSIHIHLQDGPAEYEEPSADQPAEYEEPSADQPAEYEEPSADQPAEYAAAATATATATITTTQGARGKVSEAFGRDTGAGAGADAGLYAAMPPVPARSAAAAYEEPSTGQPAVYARTKAAAAIASVVSSSAKDESKRGAGGQLCIRLRWRYRACSCSLLWQRAAKNANVLCQRGVFLLWIV